jgi:hypothetical protein
MLFSLSLSFSLLSLSLSLSLSLARAQWAIDTAESALGIACKNKNIERVCVCGRESEREKWGESIHWHVLHCRRIFSKIG